MAPRPWHSSPPSPSIHTWSLEGLRLLPHLPGYTPVMKPARAGPQTRRSGETGQDLPHRQPHRGARWGGGRCANNPLRCSPGAYVPCVGQLHRACVCKHSSLVHTPPLQSSTAPWGSPPHQVVPIFPRLICTQLQSSLAGATRTWAPRRPLSSVAFVPTPAGSPGESPAVLLPPSSTGAETRGPQNAHASVQRAGEGAFSVLSAGGAQIPAAWGQHLTQLHRTASPTASVGWAADQSWHQPQLTGGELFF